MNNFSPDQTVRTDQLAAILPTLDRGNILGRTAADMAFAFNLLNHLDYVHIIFDSSLGFSDVSISLPYENHGLAIGYLKAAMADDCT